MKKLKEAVKKVASVVVDGEKHDLEYEAKPALEAHECKLCGRSYTMKHNPGFIFGTLGPGAIPPEPGVAYMRIFNKGYDFVTAHICSFTCAQQLVDGRWRQLFPEYPETAVLENVEFSYSEVKSEKEIVQEWEDAPEQLPDFLNKKE